MIILLSPAKSLDFEKSRFTSHTQPRFLADSTLLVNVLKRKSARSIGQLMSISDQLAKLNKERFQQFDPDFSLNNAKQSILAFKGDVYQGLDGDTLSASDLNWAQTHVRILSGLYGVLRPKDLIQPYRLEMGTRLKTAKGKNLYRFWGDKITDALNEDAGKRQQVFFNLASKEYFAAVQPERLNGPLYSANFYERRNGEYKFISFTAKKARGWLCRYLIDNRITNPEDVKSFNDEGFKFNKSLSSNSEFIFTRKG